MYQVFVEKYATVTLISLLALTGFGVGLSALGAYLAYRQTTREEFVAVPVVRALMRAVNIAGVFAVLFALVLFLVSPGLASAVICIGAFASLLSFVRVYSPSVFEMLVRAGGIIAMCAAVVPVPELHRTVLPGFSALLALVPLVLLQVYRRFEHKRFVLNFWG